MRADTPRTTRKSGRAHWSPPGGAEGPPVDMVAEARYTLEVRANIPYLKFMESSPQVPLYLEDIARDRSDGINSDGALVGSRGNSADSNSGRSDSSSKARNASSSWMRSSKASTWGAQVTQHQHNRWAAALTPLVHGASSTAGVAAWVAAQVAGSSEQVVLLPA